MDIKSSSSSSSTNYPTNCLIYGARQIVQVVSKHERYLRGENMKNIAILNEDANQGKLIIVVIDGIIKYVGNENDPRYDNYKNLIFEKKINAKNCCILPGFIDPHTHPIWSGGSSAIHEFKKKISGDSVEKLCEFWNLVVEDTKKASELELEKLFLRRLKNAMKTGTTFIECKTGFGSDWHDEYKLLKVLTKVNRDKYNLKPEISITYLLSHGKQKNLKSEESIQDFIKDKFKKVELLIQNREIDVHNIDILCDQEIFRIEESQAVLEEGKKIGLNINFHGNQSLQAVEMGAKIGSKAISRLEEITIEEILQVEKSEIVLIILPSTTYMHRLNESTVRKLIDREEGCIVCLATDFSPNSYCYSMPLIMHLACISMKMSFNEALVASTINAAFSLGVENIRGSIEEDKRADFVIIETENWENIIYQFGCHDSLIKYVIINGEIVHSGF